MLYEVITQIHEVASELDQETEEILERYTAIIYDWAFLVLKAFPHKKKSRNTGQLFPEALYFNN